MKLKSIVMGFVVALVAVTLAACSSSSSSSSKDVKADNWATFQEEKSITIGFDKTFVPMGFEDQDGKYIGFDIDLAEAVFAEHGIKVNWQPINWDLKETELNNGNIDLIWNGYSVTEERKEKVLFSNPYMNTEEVLVVKKDKEISKLSDMKDRVLGAQSGSSGYEAFLANPKKLKDIVKDTDATQYETFTQAFIDLKSDRIDGILVDKVYANYYLAQEGETDNYDIISANLDSGNFAVGGRKADETLIKTINETFTKLYKDGKFQEITNKWFNEDTATDSVKGK